MWDKECEGKLREIITKAVCARGKKRFISTHTLHPEAKVDRVLGCWLANHQYKAKGFPNCVVIKGQYELNIWYAYKDNSKTEVYRETVTYTESIPYEENLIRVGKEEEIYVQEKCEPKCLSVIVKDGKVSVEVENAFYVEVIGETKLCVLAYPCDLLRDGELDKDDKDECDSEDDGDLMDADFEEANLDDFAGSDVEEEL